MTDDVRIKVSIEVGRHKYDITQLTSPELMVSFDVTKQIVDMTKYAAWDAVEAWMDEHVEGWLEAYR